MNKYEKSKKIMQLKQCLAHEKLRLYWPLFVCTEAKQHSPSYNNVARIIVIKKKPTKFFSFSNNHQTK